jgi:DNA-binding response OmpR family regulator
MQFPVFSSVTIPAVQRRIEPPPRPATVLLLITPDIDLCLKLHDIASAWNWQVKHRPDPTPLGDLDVPSITVLDADLPRCNWKDALATLRANGHCVLLVSRVFDRYLQDEVVRCGGFDVLTRTGSPEYLRRMLRFAWFRQANLDSKR